MGFVSMHKFSESLSDADQSGESHLAMGDLQRVADLSVHLSEIRIMLPVIRSFSDLSRSQLASNSRRGQIRAAWEGRLEATLRLA